MKYIDKFLFKSKNVIDVQLACRGIGLVIFMQMMLLFPDYYEIYGTKGVSRATLNALFSTPLDLNINNISDVVNIPDFVIVNVLVAFSIILSVTLVFYGKSLLSIFFLWVIHLVLVNSSFLFSYGADYMISFGLFFLLGTMLLSKMQSYFFLPISQVELLSFATRMLQLFVCIVYFFGGLGKAIGLDWLSGDAVWKVLVYFQYNITRQIYPILPALFWTIPGWIFMFAELFYPILVCNKYFRKYVLFVIILMHVGIGLILNLYVFSAIMICFNLVGFHFLITNTDDSSNRAELLAQQGQEAST